MKFFNRKKKKGKNCKVNKFILVIFGAIIGLINGLLGGGGGMICVPILEKILKLENKEAHATALAVIFPLSFVSAVVYSVTGQIQSFPLFVIGAGVVVGGIIGSYVLKILPPKAIRIIFAIIMFAGGLKLII